MKRSIYVRGPVLSQSGYGEQARFALRALKSREDLFDIYVTPIPWGQTGWIWKNDEFRQWLDSRINTTAELIQKKQLSPEVSLQITIPNEFQKICPINIGYTAGIETTNVDPSWLQKGNENMDKILVVSNHAKDTYVGTSARATNTETGEEFPYRLETPVEVVWESTPDVESESIDGFDLPYDFNFLMVSQISPRKNMANAIKWWVEEFVDQEVGLVLKCNFRRNCYIDFEHTEKTIKQILSQYPDRKCKVHLLHGDLSSGQMKHLYTHDKIKAIVNISHGEGFGLPLYEAAREGLPVVTVGWSGQLDFLKFDGVNYFQEVKHEIKQVQKEVVWQGVLPAESGWAYADQGSYKMVLRKTHKKWHKAKETAEKLVPLLKEKFDEQALYENFCSHFIDDSVVSDDEIDALFSSLAED